MSLLAVVFFIRINKYSELTFIVLFIWNIYWISTKTCHGCELPKPATDNATTGLARPLANQKRGLEIIGGHVGAKRHRLGDGDLNTIDSDNKA